MGLLSQLVEGSKSPPPLPARRGSLWREVFGTDKERPAKKPPPGPGWGRSMVSTDASTKRLIQAMRSMAPGGWSDDRWEQTKHFVGIAYVAIHRCGEQMAQSEFQVFRKDPRAPDGKRPVTRHDAPESGRLVRPYDLVTLLEKPNREDSWGDLAYCFPPGTKVRMADGGQKNIEKVCLADEVVSAEGNVRRVRQCHVREYDGDLVKVELWGHRHLLLTPNHKVLTERGYVASGDLQVGDYVAIPRYAPSRCKVLQTADHVKGEMAQVKEYYPGRYYGHEARLEPGTGGIPWANYKRVPDFVELTPGAGRIFGLFLAEGHTSKHAVCWSFNVTETDTLANDLVELLEKEWGVNSKTQVRGSVIQVSIGGALWVRLFRSLCGVGAGAKRVHADLLGGPNEFLAGLVKGWMDGDGCRGKSDGKWVGATVSHELALNMFDIANYLGWRPAILRSEPSGVGDKIKGVVVKSRQVGWRVYLKSMSDNYRVRMDDEVVWRRVSGSGRQHYCGDVYNIGVDKDNSYIAEGIGTHNCWNQQMDLTGTALTWMVPNAIGTPMELYVVPTATAIPQPAVNPDYPDGYYRIQPLYPYGPFSTYPTPASAVGAAIPAQWMLRFKYPHPLLRYEGYAPLTAMRLSLDVIESIYRSRWYSMKRSINPSAVVNFDEFEGSEPLDEQEIDRIHAEWEAEFQGPENTGKLIVAPPGGKVEPWGARPVDMDYANGWDQETSFAMAGFGITKPAAGMIEESSYASLFATLKQLHLLTLAPKCARFGAKLTRFLAPFYGDDLIVEVRCPRIDDHEIKNGKLQMLVGAKAITKNELRMELDMPLTKDEWGEDMAGDASPKEQEQQQQGQMGGMLPGMGAPPGGIPMPGQEQPLPTDESVMPSPDTGTLGQGALGPQKSLSRRLRVLRALHETARNGHAVGV